MSSRYFNTKFWRDSYIDSLDPSEKLLYIHTFTNPEASICGIYEMPKRLMASDTGFNVDMLDKLFTRLEKDKKAIYHEGWVCTFNTIKHQNINNGNTRKGIERELSEIPENILDYFLEMGTEEFRETIRSFNIEVPTYAGATEKTLQGKKRVNPPTPPKPKKEIVAVSYPEWLNIEAWEEWFKFRKEEKRKTITDSARNKQWALLQKYTMEEQRKIIDNSIQNDYQGLFDLKPGMSNAKKSFHVA